MKRTLHPQAVPGEPSAVRWVVEVDLPVGRVTAAPGTVGPLIEYGVLTKVFVERGGVWTWLAPGRTWTEHGPRVRDALAAAGQSSQAPPKSSVSRPPWAEATVITPPCEAT